MQVDIVATKHRKTRTTKKELKSPVLLFIERIL